MRTLKVVKMTATTYEIVRGPSQFGLMVHMHDDQQAESSINDFEITATDVDVRYRHKPELKTQGSMRIGFPVRLEMIRRVKGYPGVWDIEGVATMREGYTRQFSGSYSTRTRKGSMEFSS